MISEELIELQAKIANPVSWSYANRKWPKHIAPTIQRSGYVRRPLPGYVGDAYDRTKIVFLGTNPGPGKGQGNSFPWDIELFKTLLPDFVRNPNIETFKRLNDCLAWVMPKWGIFSRIDFPSSFGLRMEEFAYSNVLLVNTPDGTRPHEVHPKVFGYSIKRFLAPWLEMLKPRLIVVFGKAAERLLETYWQSKPLGLQIVSAPLPTFQVMNTHPETFQADLDAAKTAIVKVSPQAKRRLQRSAN